MLHIIPKAFSALCNTKHPPKGLVPLRSCPLGSQTQPAWGKWLGSPCLHSPLLSHVPWEGATQLFYIKRWSISSSFLILPQRYANINKRHDSYPQRGEISGISGQQVRKIFSHWWRQREATGAPPSTQHRWSDCWVAVPLLARFLL